MSLSRFSQLATCSFTCTLDAGIHEFSEQYMETDDLDGGEESKWFLVPRRKVAGTPWVRQYDPNKLESSSANPVQRSCHVRTPSYADNGGGYERVRGAEMPFRTRTCNDCLDLRQGIRWSYFHFLSVLEVGTTLDDLMRSKAERSSVRRGNWELKILNSGHPCP